LKASISKEGGCQILFKTDLDHKIDGLAAQQSAMNNERAAFF
jgi:hypothetical protein